METIKKNLEEKSKKSIAVLKEDLNTVRAGRANPALLDKAMVISFTGRRSVVLFGHNRI